MMIPPLSEQVIKAATQNQLMLTTAESCTGGLIAARLTDVAGASAAFYGGFSTYTNDAKMHILSVPHQTLQDEGAVSAQTAACMAQGALVASRFHAQLSIAVTGIAGPKGGTPQKPVGLVWFGLAAAQHSHAACRTYTAQRRFGRLTRAEIREKTVTYALEMLLAFMTDPATLEATCASGQD